MEVYYEGSQRYMQGRGRVRQLEEELTPVQQAILQELSDGQLHSIGELRSKLQLSESKIMWELDELGRSRPVYEQSYGRRCSVGILTEACFA